MAPRSGIKGGKGVANQPQFFAGLLFTAIGAAALAGACSYPLGTPARIGPGFYPLVLAILLLVLGPASALTALRSAPMPRVQDWPLLAGLLVLSGVVVFALLIERAGLFAAGLGLMALACLTRLRSRTFEFAVIAAALLLFVYVLFVRLLAMPIPPF